MALRLLLCVSTNGAAAAAPSPTEAPMNISTGATALAYAVAVDRSSLGDAPLLGTGNGFSVELTGPVDKNWLECYRVLRVESPSFFRFCLEGRRILFACRSEDVVSDVEGVLKTLDSLIKRVNALASVNATDP
jgi:hypothetical protein